MVKFTISLPQGTFWEIASFFILAAGTVFALIKWGVWLIPYFGRARQFRLEIGNNLCSNDYSATLPQSQEYKRNQTLVVDQAQTITFLLRLKSKQKQIHFQLRLLGDDGRDMPNSKIAFIKAEGFQAYPQYWVVNGQADNQGCLRGTISFPTWRGAEKDCYMRITAKLRQSVRGTLRFEGQYRLPDDRELSGRTEARLKIQTRS